MVEAGTLGLSQSDESFAHPQGRLVVLQVALHDRVFECGIEGSVEHMWVRVAHAVYADADDEVEFDAAIAQFDEGAIAQPATDVREEQRSAASGCQTGQLVTVSLSQRGVGWTDGIDFGAVFLEGLAQQFSGLFDPRVADQTGVP